MEKYIGHKTQGEILRSFYFENFKNCDIMHLKEYNKYLDLNI